eukprot:RCo029830
MAYGSVTPRNPKVDHSNVLPSKPRALSLPSSLTSSKPAGVVRVLSLAVTFTALPVRRHLGRPLRVALRLPGGRWAHSRKCRAEVQNGLASVRWGEGVVVAGVTRTMTTEPHPCVLRLELQAHGLLSATTLSFMSIDLSKLEVNAPRTHQIDFGFGTLTAELQLERPGNPLLRG